MGVAWLTVLQAYGGAVSFHLPNETRYISSSAHLQVIWNAGLPFLLLKFNYCFPSQADKTACVHEASYILLIHISCSIWQV